MGLCLSLHPSVKYHILSDRLSQTPADLVKHGESLCDQDKESTAMLVAL